MGSSFDPCSFTTLSAQFVVAIADGRVTGVVGSVYDASGRFFTEFSPALTDLPVSEEQVGLRRAGQGRKIDKGIAAMRLRAAWRARPGLTPSMPMLP